MGQAPPPVRLQYRFTFPGLIWEGEVEVGAEPLQIGRTPGGLAPPYARRVSRRHAVVTLENGRCWIKDLGSRAGTLLGARDGSKRFAPVRQAELDAENYADCGGLVVALLEGPPIPATGLRRAIVCRADGGVLRAEHLEILGSKPIVAEDGRAASVRLEGLSVAGLSKALGPEFQVDGDVQFNPLARA